MSGARAIRLADPQARKAHAGPRPAGPADPHPGAALAAHRVLFYAHDGPMLEETARFLLAGLDAGDAGIVIATPPHAEALRERLGDAAAGVRFLDAAGTLEAFLAGDRVDPARFDAAVGGAVRDALRQGNGRVRAFGEMVALLAAAGRMDAAVALEAAWNRLLDGKPATLLCAYPLELFHGAGGSEDLHAVCAEHGDVEPVGGPAATVDGERRRVVQLQQQVEALRGPALAAHAAALAQRERKQAAVARVGHLALRSKDLDALFREACREVAEGLGVDACALLERVPGSAEVAYRAGHGYPDGLRATVSAGPGTQAAFVLRSGQAVLYHDLRAERRFQPSPLLMEHGIRGGMGVVVPTTHGPWGILGAHVRRLHGFTPDDVNFLEAIAHVLGSAIERREAEAEVQRSRDRLEAVVRERTQRLEHANRELDAFTSAVSHDLRGPVRAIAGFSTLLAQRHAGRLDPHGRELLEEVRRAATRMGDLIEDLLDLSRADRTAPQRVPVDLSALARAILQEEAERNPGRKVLCEVEDDLVVEGDADLLRMAMENLLANAWKFTSRRADARITVSKRREGEDLVLCVQDNGAGFDMADAGRLFQPFQRLHRRSDFEGTGIGLATVRRIIERHGGRIWAQAKPVGGASFYFTLPGSPA